LVHGSKRYFERTLPFLDSLKFLTAAVINNEPIYVSAKIMAEE
jgi:hypothetical protein